jgi:hypothetical protein
MMFLVTRQLTGLDMPNVAVSSTNPWHTHTTDCVGSASDMLGNIHSVILFKGKA